MESIVPLLLDFREKLNPLIYIGLLLLLSYAGGQIANYLKAPRVLGYLLTGMLCSSSFLGIFHHRLVKEEFGLLTHIALAIIAFSIGGSLGLPSLRRLGKQILSITLTQALFAFLLATLTLSIFFLWTECSGKLLDCFWTSYFPITLVIGAISAATAPAATLAIVHEYRAKGPLTTILLGVVALDDALTVLLFAFAMSVAQSFVSYDAVGIHKVLLAPALSILISLSIGGIVGLCLCKLIRFVPNREVMLGVILGCIFLTAGLAESLWGHPLLANMMLGFVVANFVKHHDDLFAVVESIEEPLFGMFFALAGAHLDLAMVKTAGVLALMITLGRFSGKILGSIFGAQISHAPSTVKRYLGLALLPTAGVTVGLALKASEVFEASDLSELIVNGVLGSVIINELLTPFLVRLSLSKAGETIQQRRSTKEIEG